MIAHLLNRAVEDGEVSQKLLAHASAMSPATVSRWCSGEAEPGWPALCAIVRSTDLPAGLRLRIVQELIGTAGDLWAAQCVATAPTTGGTTPGCDASGAILAASEVALTAAEQNKALIGELAGGRMSHDSAARLLKIASALGEHVARFSAVVRSLESRSEHRPCRQCRPARSTGGRR